LSKYKVASNSAFWIIDAASTLRNMSAYIDTISNPPGKEYASLDVTSFNDAAMRFIAGIEQGGEFTVSGHFDDAALSGPNAVFGVLPGTATTFAFYPASTATGNRRFSGTALCLSYRTPVSVAERVNYEARFVVDGTVTVGTSNGTGTA